MTDRTKINKLLICLMLLITVLAVIPVFIGQLIKSQLAAALGLLEIENPQLRVEIVSHEAGWIDSELHYRIHQFSRFDAGQPAFILDIQATGSHGLILRAPFGVGLVRLRGTVLYQSPLLLEPVEIPANATTNLLGHTTARFTVATQTHPTQRGSQLGFETGQLQMKVNGSGTRIEFAAELAGFSLSGASKDFELGASTMSAKFDLSDELLWLGRLQAELGEVRIQGETFGASRIDLNAGEQDEQINYRLNTEMQTPSSQGFGYGPGTVALEVSKLDAAGLATLLFLSSHAPDEPGALLPIMVNALPDVLVHGPRLSIEPFTLITDGGELRGYLELDIPATKGSGLAGLVLSAGKTRLVIPAELMSHWQRDSVFTELWYTLNRSNILWREDTSFRFESEYKNKKLTMNGEDYRLPFGF